MRLGRAVTFDDLLAFHNRCKWCLRTGRITVQRPGDRPRVTYCRALLEDFYAAAAGRFAEGPRGDTYWLSGMSPEEWTLYLIFNAGMHAQWDMLRWSASERHLWARQARN